MAREVLSNGVINPDKYQADWYADLSNNWNLLNNLIGSAISGSEVDSKIATAIQELMVRTFQIVAELPETGTEGVMYLVAIPNTSKYTAYVWENSAYRELGVIQMTITIDDELSTTSENPLQNKVTTNALNGKANISHTHTASDITSGLATVATSGSYNDLSNKPTIPTVNDATLTIQQNGTNVQTFTANASTNATANIQCVDLTNNQTVGGIKTFSNAPVVGSINLDGKTIDTDVNDNMTYDSHIVDTIEEQGEGYIRYSNGLQICWGTISIQSSCSSPWGSLFESNLIRGSYTKSFVKKPAISISGDIGGSASIIESTVVSNTSTPEIWLCRATAKTEVVTCTARYVAIGCWK